MHVDEPVTCRGFAPGRAATTSSRSSRSTADRSEDESVTWRAARSLRQRSRSWETRTTAHGWAARARPAQLSGAQPSIVRTRSSNASTPSRCRRSRCLRCGVRQAVERRREHHHRRDARARHLGRVVHRAGRHHLAYAAAALDDVAGELHEVGVERDRVDRPQHVDGCSTCSSAAISATRVEPGDERASVSRWRMSTLNSVRPFTAVG